jgi:hypothetical protein
LSEAIHDQNPRFSRLVECLHYVAPNESGATGNDYQTTPLYPVIMYKKAEDSH